ncbi:MAG: neutral zinc metallopeptidase [Geminicoccaceae bacterium]
MRWEMGRRSQNIEDRRGMGPGMGGMPRGVRVGSGGGLGLIVIALLGWLVFGINPLALLQGGGGMMVPDQTTTSRQAPTRPSKQLGTDDKEGQFVSAVLADTEDTWTPIFAQQGRRYTEPKLVLYENVVNSACGMAQSATGPFYCPGDQKVYLDTAFFDELAQKFGAPGDFAAAYVIAHEIGHHVQTLLGITQQVSQYRSRVSEAQGNQISVMTELQADCFAGVWAHNAARERNLLQEGDIEEGLRAAAAVGDDKIMKRTQGYVVPDAFTHGSADQRMRWFMAGLKSGDMNSCDTFNAKQL